MDGGEEADEKSALDKFRFLFQAKRRIFCVSVRQSIDRVDGGVPNQQWQLLELIRPRSCSTGCEFPMNKAFVREPDTTADYCPHCGSKGEPVGPETLETFLTDGQRENISRSANFCPSAKCDVVYFDGFERTILATEVQRPVYPKDPTAPVCGCFGLTQDDIQEDVREGVTARVREVIEKAKSPSARCRQMAANGKPCTAYVQKCYMQCLHAKGDSHAQ